MDIKIVLTVGLSVLLSANQFDEALEEELSWLKEETYVISASRVKEDIDKTASSISVIDEEMIEKIGANNILELLEIVTGLEVTQSNIFIEELGIRGVKDFTSKQILFMVDGHSLDGNLLNGGATSNFSEMSLDNIKRIEIIKGPASALYGGNAFTGLINIITKDAEDIDGVELKLKGGSYGYRETNILFGEKFGDLSVVGNLNFKAFDGEKDLVQKDILGRSGETDPYHQSIKADLKMDYQNFYLQSIFTKRKDGSYYGVNGAMVDDTKTKFDYLALEFGYKKAFSERLNILTRFYTDILSFDNDRGIYPEGYQPQVDINTMIAMNPALAQQMGGVPQIPIFANGMNVINRLTNQKDGAEALFTYRPLENYTIVFGGTYEKHKQYDVESYQDFNPETPIPTPLPSMRDYTGTEFSFAPEVSREMWAGYINNIYDVTDSLRVTVGGRYDDYSDFGSNFAPRGGVSWQINREHILKFMYGEGFRTPTFAEYYNRHIAITGNQNLQPEYVSTYETSLHSKFNKLETTLALFQNDFRDLISQEGTIYRNIGEAETKGVEVEAKYNLNRGSYIMANYTYQLATDKLNNTSLPDVATHKGNIFFNQRVSQNINIFTHIFLKGETERADGDSREPLSGYALLNLSLNAKDIFLKNLQFQLSLRNIFDKDAYSPSYFLKTPEDDYRRDGRNLFLEVKYRF